MKFEPRLSFDHLQKEVVDRGTCGRCGGCVSFCTANRIGALEMGEDGFPRYKKEAECLECGLCYLICPQTVDLNDSLKDEFRWKAPIGYVEDLHSLRATNREIQEVATDGGVVTALLCHMLEKNFIDGAVVSKRDGLFNRRSVVATTPDELLEAAGSSFSEAPHLDKMGTAYSSCVPVANTIREYSQKKLHKLAVVGTPCQIDAVRKMQILNILPSDIIEFTIGLFCMQCFSMERLINSQFLETHHIHAENINKINVKEDFFLHTKTGEIIHIPLEEVESIARPACLACTRFSNDFADISVGGLGSPEGYTTVLTRSINGKRIIAGVLSDGSIEKNQCNKEKTLSLIKKMAEKKMNRGTATQKKLEALSCH